MSVLSTINAQGADVLGAVHNDDLVLQPMNQAAVGNVEVVTADKAAKRQPGLLRLHIGQETFSHIVHIKPEHLVGVTLRDVARIECLGKTYRVKHFTNDAVANPEVDFFCELV